MAGTYDYLDGVVYADSCSPGRSLIEAIAYLKCVPAYFSLSYPSDSNATTIEFFAAELKEFLKFLERATKSKISDEAIWSAVKIYQERRLLIKELYDLRYSDAFPLTGKQCCETIMAGLVTEVKQYNSILRELIGT